MHKLPVILMLPLIFLPGCAIKPTRFVYRETGSDVYYMSKEEMPFKATIHGFNWKVQQIKDKTIVLSRVSPSPVVINFYEYNESRFDPKFFKDGFNEARSLKEYTNAEFKFYTKKNESPQVLAENLEGKLRPNVLWSFTTEKGSKVYNISAAQNEHLITISYQASATTAPDELKEIFKSITPLTKDEANKIIETIEDKNADSE